MAFKMRGFNPGKGTGIDKNIRKINKAKRLTRKHVKNTTVDSPTWGTKKSDRKFPRSEKKMNKVVDLLRDQGYSEGEIEQFTGATGYKDAMDWATEPMAKQNSSPSPKSPLPPETRGWSGTMGEIGEEMLSDSPLKKGGRRTKKTVKTKQAIEDAMYSEDDVIDEPTKYSDQDKKEGAGSSTEFYQIEGGDTKTKKKYRIGLSDRKTDGSLRTYKTGKKKGQAGKKVPAILSEDVVKTTRKGKTKKTKYKDTAKKSLFGKKRSIQLDSYAKQEAEAKRTGVDSSEITDFGKTKFTGEYKKPLKEKDKKRKRKATLTTRGKNAGKIEEKIKRWHGIGYRKTGRVIEDQAFKDKRS